MVGVKTAVSCIRVGEGGGVAVAGCCVARVTTTASAAGSKVCGAQAASKARASQHNNQWGLKGKCFF